MKRIVIQILFIVVLAVPSVLAQHYSSAVNGYILNSTVHKGDTIPLVILRDVPIYPKKFKNKKQEKFYWKTVRDVKVVYPYVKIVGSEYARINTMFDTVTDEKLREKYTKKYERELLKKYTPIMSDFTLSQGKMMIKLIDRETDKNAYSIIKEIRGGFVAWWWQAFAKMVGSDLKEDYNASEREKDQIIERVITLYEAGLL